MEQRINKHCEDAKEAGAAACLDIARREVASPGSVEASEIATALQASGWRAVDLENRIATQRRRDGVRKNIEHADAEIATLGENQNRAAATLAIVEANADAARKEFETAFEGRRGRVTQINDHRKFLDDTAHLELNNG